MLNMLVTFLALAFLGMALAVLGLQALYYLKEGGLLPMSLVDGLQTLNVGWANDPNVLLGLHEALKQLPLSLIFLVLASVFFFVKRYLTKK
jgi:hypothetical protein